MRHTDHDRTTAVAHYVIARSRPDQLGATKLRKVMWYADLAAYRKHGKTITGQESYRKLPKGPVPNGIERSIRDLEIAGAITTRRTATPVGARHEYVWLEQPDTSIFDADELDILNEVIDFICENFSAAGISEVSHDALWEEITLGDQIPVGAASIVIGEVTESDLDWAMSAIKHVQ